MAIGNYVQPLAHPDPNFISPMLQPLAHPDPNFISPMLQPYLEQQQAGIQSGLPTPSDGDSEDAASITDGCQSPVNMNNNSMVPEPNSTSNGGTIKLFHVSFNQDYGCFATGTDRGFRIYNCDPFREIFRRDFEGNGGGIGSVEMLFRCNIHALVGGGDSPQYPLNKVMILDDHQRRCIGELSFRSEVRGVRLRRDRIVLFLEQKIFVYNFADLKLLHQIETIANSKWGSVRFHMWRGLFVLVCPGLQKGQVRVEHYASKRTKFINAHDSRIACITLSQDGNLLATSSSKGTLVRIYNTHDGSLLQEFAGNFSCQLLPGRKCLIKKALELMQVRRGADRAEIYSLAFSPTVQWLAVSSDKGTVHIFSLKVPSGNGGTESSNSPDTSPGLNSNSSFSFIKGVLPKYFNSEWSVAQFRLPEGLLYTVAFGHQKNTVVILGLDGSFFRCKFDPATGGEMTQLEYHNFLKPDE